jgi:hypothetical protein
MKILKLALIGVILVACFKLFPQEDKKAEKARKELSEAMADSAADFLKFKQVAETNISNNKKKIAVLKAKKSNADKEVNKKYTKKVLALEQNNNTLEKKIDECNTTKTNAWTSFKLGFNRDMKALGNALDNIKIEQFETSD